jgi:hypothetical protein
LTFAIDVSIESVNRLAREPAEVAIPAGARNVISDIVMRLLEIVAEEFYHCLRAGNRYQRKND